MEDRIALARPEQRGLALTALVVIIAITAAWWALALWPASGVEPEWLARTRAACFGSTHGGLPDAGGWILLVGEPLGMVGVLVAVWGRSLALDLHAARSNRRWQLVGVVATGIVVVGVGTAGVRVARAAAVGPWGVASGPRAPTKPDVIAPALTLTDQRGVPRSLADFRGQTVMLTFAFGHCSTVCPAVVSDLRAERRAAKRPDVPIVVITLDPWRDTPDRLATIAAHWELSPGDYVLSGSVTEVQRALDALGIARTRDERTGDLVHGTTVLILDPRGRIAWRADGWWAGVGRLLERT